MCIRDKSWALQHWRPEPFLPCDRHKDHMCHILSSNSALNIVKQIVVVRVSNEGVDVVILICCKIKCLFLWYSILTASSLPWSEAWKKKHYSGLGEPLLSLKQSLILFISGIGHLMFDLFWIGFFARCFYHLKPCCKIPSHLLRKTNSASSTFVKSPSDT